jgi:hypothetical protein
VPSDVIVNDTFDFDYVPDSGSQDYIHVFKNGNELYDGIALIPKTAILTADNIQIRFSHNTKNVDIVASTPCPYDIFNIDTFEEYTYALENSTTEMFWMSTSSIDIDLSVVNNFYIPHTDIHSRNKSHAFLHCIADTRNYNGIFLCSKNTPLSKREVTYRFPVNRIEHDIVASTPKPYDVFYINTYAEYTQALENSTTEMFFVVPGDVVVADEFKFDINFTFDNIYDRNINHVYLNGTEYSGIVLYSKASKITKTEFINKDIANKKQVSIVASTPKPYDVFYINTYEEYTRAFKTSTTEMFFVVPDDVVVANEFKFDINFTFDNIYDRNINHVYLNDIEYSGIVLYSKACKITKKEFINKDIANKKQVAIVASTPRPYDVFYINTYAEYTQALENSTTEMFFVVPDDVVVADEFKFDIHFTFDNIYDRNINHVYLNGTEYSGIMLCSKNTPLSKREVTYRFPVNRIEHDIVASTPRPYDVFYINTYEEYAQAFKTSTTEMFFVVPDDVVVADEFKFDIHFTFDNIYDRNINHVYLNGTVYNGIMLCSKASKITKTEFINKDIANKKQVAIVASTPKPYDVFYINTYAEYTQALENSTTEMFFVVPGDVVVADEFKFDINFTFDNIYDRNINHVYLNDTEYSGIMLCSKASKITKKEFVNKDIKNKKQVAVVASIPRPYDVFYINTYEEYTQALENSTTEMFFVVPDDVVVANEFKFDINFTFDNIYDRNINHVYLNGTEYSGIMLCSKNTPLSKREVAYRFPVNRIEHDIVASTPKLYDVFYINTYAEYTQAFKTSTTEMFFVVPGDVIVANEFKFDIHFTFDNIYDRNINHVYLNDTEYSGIMLCSKASKITKKEFINKDIKNKKQVAIVASTPKPYDVFYINTYAEYTQALKTSTTEMFFVVPNEVVVADEFKFDVHFTFDHVYDRNINHVYLNGTEYSGIMLCSKASKITKKEFISKDIDNKKQVAIVASTPKPYDIVFISYEEPNADKNYQDLLKIAPRAFRVHGITGIHNAHIAAAKLCKSKMFWVVDADATIINNFTFDLQVHDSNLTSVHVWRSQNPINELVYGYGGVKLLPRVLTENMDTSKTDMTTGISDQFKLMPKISNITSFNTDPYSTWKSSFRECVKLSSKLIDRQKNVETQKRLHIWCTVGDNKLYGKHAIAGANAGAAYGKANKGNSAALKKINDFDWLKEQYDNSGYK